MSRMNWDRVRRERNLYRDVPTYHHASAPTTRRTTPARPRPRSQRPCNTTHRSRLAATELQLIDERVTGAACTRCGASTKDIWSTPCGHRWCSRCDLQWRAAA